jgi:hypothetical protein
MMNSKLKAAFITLAILGYLSIQSACNNAVVNPTQAPVGLKTIDNILTNAMTGHIAYNAPQAMQLDETTDIQLLLSPSASADELKHQIVASGQVSEAEVLITPLMKAELLSDDPQAFTIQAIHDNPEQVVLMDAPTEWRWSVSARKSGDQMLTMILYRQIQYNGQTYWRMVETYKSKIHITVSPEQQLRRFDWKWLVGILLTAILIPALWRFIDQRNKRKTARKSKE